MKEKFLDSFVQQDGRLRIVIATTAFSKEYNIKVKNINFVVKL